MLTINNLHITVDHKEVVKGVTLNIRPGEIHALMGPNGSGKSSLAMAIAGHPRYGVAGKGRRTKVIDLFESEDSAESERPEGTFVSERLSLEELRPEWDEGRRRPIIELDGEDITTMTPDERARMGLFLAMQYPVSVEGITVEQLLRRSLQEKLTNSQTHKVTKKQTNVQMYKNTKRSNTPNIPNTPNPLIDVLAFRKQLERLAEKVGVTKELLRRSINVGFSGGEKKRLEILQMLVLQPKYAILDETDSGLDVDALRTIAETVKTAEWLNGYKPGILVITHYARLLKYLKPDIVHIMKEGKIVESGGKELAEKIEKKGYGGKLKDQSAKIKA